MALLKGADGKAITLRNRDFEADQRKYLRKTLDSHFIGNGFLGGNFYEYADEISGFQQTINGTLQSVEIYCNLTQEYSFNLPGLIHIWRNTISPNSSSYNFSTYIGGIAIPGDVGGQNTLTATLLDPTPGSNPTYKVSASRGNGNVYQLISGSYIEYRYM